MIWLLMRARHLRVLSVLTRIDRPIPRAALQSVVSMAPIVLHGTEAGGFASLCAPGCALRALRVRDTDQLRFDRLLGAMEGMAGRSNLTELVVFCAEAEPSRTMGWVAWCRHFAELLAHPLMANLEHAALPVPSAFQNALACGEALLADIGGLPKLRSLRLVPYSPPDRGFAEPPPPPDLNAGGPADSDRGPTPKELGEAFATRWRAALPAVSLSFAGVA